MRRIGRIRGKTGKSIHKYGAQEGWLTAIEKYSAPGNASGNLLNETEKQTWSATNPVLWKWFAGFLVFTLVGLVVSVALIGYGLLGNPINSKYVAWFEREVHPKGQHNIVFVRLEGEALKEEGPISAGLDKCNIPFEVKQKKKELMLVIPLEHWEKAWECLDPSLKSIKGASYWIPDRRRF